jgi:hypothetical protein
MIFPLTLAICLSAFLIAMVCWTVFFMYVHAPRDVYEELPE